MKNDYWPPLISGNYYHVYNRGNNHENIFYNQDNIRFFLNRYAKYVHLVAETYAYCLLPNHFHALIRIKTKAEIEYAIRHILIEAIKLIDGASTNFEHISLADLYNHCLRLPQCHAAIKEKVSLPPIPVSEDTGLIVGEKFRLFFMSYAKSINLRQGRTGSLFQKTFRRKMVGDDQYLKMVVQYIHTNPQRHGLCGNFEDWKDSSYPAMLSNDPTRLRREDVMNWFGGRSSLIECHRRYIDEKLLESVWIEEG